MERFTREFCELPGRVRQAPYRIALLPPDTWKQFLVRPFPFAREFWLCCEQDRAVGRIGANVSATDPAKGFFGFFDLDLSAGNQHVAGALIGSACNWLRDQGVKQVIGPIAFNTWFPYRVRIDDGDARIFAWEPVNPPEYVSLLEASGLELGAHYTSTAFGDLRRFLKKMEPSHRNAVASGFTFRPLRRSSIDADIPALYRISVSAFQDSYLFEPIPETLFAQLYVSIADREKENASWIVVDPVGVEVGFVYAFLDRCRHAGRAETAVVLKSLAIVPEARGKALSNALLYLVVRDSLQMGADYGIAALVRSGIQSEVYARKGKFLWRHEYGLWRKRLG